MEEITNILAKTELFIGIKQTDIQRLLKCFNAREAVFEKDEIIHWEQSVVTEIGILLSGSAVAYRSTAAGNQVIMNHLKKAAVFGDILAADPSRTSPVTIRAQEHSRILFIPYDRFIGGPAVQCAGYAHLMHNYIEAISRRYFALQDRVACLIMPNLRDKILYFLQEQNKENKREPFSIPFDRASMAAYLNADRSALSRELSALKKEGIIDYHKNTFKVL